MTEPRLIALYGQCPYDTVDRVSPSPFDGPGRWNGPAELLSCPKAGKLDAKPATIP